MRHLSKSADTGKKPIQQNSKSILITQKMITRGIEDKSSRGGFTTKKQVKKQVSYGRREDYITNYEERLMSRYRIGYSDLVKMLIVKAAQSEFHDLTPFR